MNSEKLIKEVKERPCLWDMTSEHYHSRLIVEKEWDDISKSMGIETEALKKKWKNLRDQFRAELRRIPNRRSNNTSPSWTFFEPLSFLKDQMKLRSEHDSSKSSKNTRNSKRKSTADISESHSVEAKIEPENSEEKFTKPQEGVPETNEAPNGGLIKKRKRNSESLATEKRKLELEESNHDGIQKGPKDEDESFFDSLLPHARKLKPAQKLLCRMEIQEIIYKYVYSDQENGIDMNSSVTVVNSPIPELSSIDVYPEVKMEVNFSAE